MFAIIILLFIGATSASMVCHHCQGINCQRSNSNKTETCVNDMDACVTVFDGFAVEAQGCLQSMPEDLRRKCMGNNMEMPRPMGNDMGMSRPMENDMEMPRAGEMQMEQCFVCLSDRCNDKGPKGYECIQCDSTKDERCRNDPAALMPTPCPISRASNAYCYVTDNGSHTVRGCAENLQMQKDCLGQKSCSICSPMDFRACNVIQIESDEGGDGNGGGGNNGGSGGSGGSNGGNDGGNGGGNGGSGGGSGGNDGSSGGNGTGSGGSGGNNNSHGSIITFNIKALLICSTAVIIGSRFA